MKHLPALAAALLLAVGAQAQSPLTDSTGTYVQPIFGYSVVGSQGSAAIGGVALGTRVSDNVDLGFRLFGGDNSFSGTSLVVGGGPTLGVSGSLGRFDAYANLAGTAVFGETLSADASSGLQSLGLQSSATLGYPLDLGRSVRLAPTLGAYANVCTSFVEGSPGGQCAELGALAGVDLAFRALGAEVSVPLLVPISIMGSTKGAAPGAFGLQSLPATSGLRIRF
ncbi:MAG: hypothetical protein AAGI52_12905 [Bacteroidota bacterium]